MKTVAVIVQEGFAPFEFGLACEAFGLDRSDDGIPNFDFRIVTPDPGAIRSQAGLLDQRRCTTSPSPTRPTSSWSRRPRAGTGARSTERCSSRPRARPSAAPGCSASAADRSCSRHPESRRSPGDHPLDVRGHDGLDVPRDRRRSRCALRAGRPHHHERRHGRRARRLPAPPASGARRRDDEQDRAPHGRASAARRRPGAVHLEARCPRWRRCRSRRSPTGCSRTCAQELTVDQLAAKAHMSPRTFARRFKADSARRRRRGSRGSGSSTRSACSRQTDLGLDRIAYESGFGSAAVLRQNFARVLDTTPTAYRATLLLHAGRWSASIAGA